MTATGICYCLEISLNGTTVAFTFFGVLDVRGVTP
ncbi:putative membrane protein [Pseudomonas syringae pv. cerasicola]|nr:putative membrane protein [Pseudomonas syringae pv. cerasicola]SPF15419.1 putative membrane protein [Pseudomonas syringae pv. cerasicola]